MAGVDWGIALTTWQHGPLATTGTLLEVGSAALYLYGVRHVRAAGLAWSAARTRSFLGGLVVLAVALQWGPSAYDDVPWLHALQHVLLMMVAPPLLVFGRPTFLALRAGGPRTRGAVMGILRDPSLRLVDGPAAAWLLPIDYSVSMAAMYLTPLWSYTRDHVWAHDLTHLYLVSCGVLLWQPLAGWSAGRWHPDARTRWRMAASAVPAIALLGIAVVAWPAVLSGTAIADARLAGWTLVVAGGGAALAGTALVLPRASVS